MAVPAEVLKVLGRMGIKGVSRVRCRVLDGTEKGKVLTRNVVGPIREGDVIMAKETEMESVGDLKGR
jgi:small subunit ribosomal protein S28e